VVNFLARSEDIRALNRDEVENLLENRHFGYHVSLREPFSNMCQSLVDSRSLAVM